MEDMDFGYLIPVSQCKKFSGLGDCEEINGLCIDNPDCYFKQISKLKEDAEQLKAKLNLLEITYQTTINELKKENKKLKQDLERMSK